MRISDWSSDVCSSDLATDYAKADPARSFAERRGITFRERVAEIVRQAPEKARGMFDGLRLAIGGQDRGAPAAPERQRSEEHTSELQSLMRISFAVSRLKKKIQRLHSHLYITHPICSSFLHT